MVWFGCGLITVGLAFTCLENAVISFLSAGGWVVPFISGQWILFSWVVGGSFSWSGCSFSIEGRQSGPRTELSKHCEITREPFHLYLVKPALLTTAMCVLACRHGHGIEGGNQPSPLTPRGCFPIPSGHCLRLGDPATPWIR